MEQRPEKTLNAQLHDNFWVAYQNRTDLVESIKEDERFYAGDQYDGPNPQNNPRITINKIQDAIRKLASKICGTPFHLAMSASNLDKSVTALVRYDEFVLAKIGHEAFSFQSVVNAENLGTEIVYVGFDSDAPYDIGGFYMGGICENHISPLEFAVSNPREHEVQKQDWVMTWTEDYVKNLASIIEKDNALSKKEKKERIEALRLEGRKQFSDSTNPDVDIINNTLVRVYMRFFRIDKEVLYTLETENVSLSKYPFPLSKRVARNYAKKITEAYEAYDKRHKGEERPDGEDDQLIRDLDFDYPDTIINAPAEEAGQGAFSQYQEKFSLYPFAIYTPKEINNSIFGMSITKSMIPIQQAINYAASLQVKYLQNMAFPKTVVKEDALGGQQWNNDPADNIVTDYSRGEAFGFKTLETPNMPNDAQKIPDWLNSIMKETYGIGDIISGQINSGDTSGYLYSLALKQANSTLEQEQRLYWKFQVDLARIRVMFYKHYVDKRQYTYELDDVEYDEEEEARGAIISGYSNGLSLKDSNGMDIPPEAIMERYGKPTQRTQIRTFDGKDMWGTDFDIKIVAQQGLLETELNTQQWYTNMFGNGQIQQYEEHPEMISFIAETAPKGVVPEEYRATMKHYGSKMERKLCVRLRKENQEQAMMIQELQAQIQQLTMQGQEQQKEFANRLNAAAGLVRNAQTANAQTQRQMQAMMKPTKVDEGQVKSNNAKGMPTDVSSLLVEQPTI